MSRVKMWRLILPPPQEIMLKTWGKLESVEYTKNGKVIKLPTPIKETKEDK